MLFSNDTEVVNKIAENFLKGSFSLQIPLSNNYKKHIAFTLAEVLIVLSIIGIIVSLTIPSIIQDAQNAELKTAWKKSYADISAATSRLIMDNGGSLKGVLNCDNVVQYYSNYLSYLKSCPQGTNVFVNCWHDVNITKSLSGLSLNSTALDEGAMILSNGTLLNFSDFRYAHNCDIDDHCGCIYVDVNGFKGPNSIGKDVFTIHVLKNGIKPYGTEDDDYAGSLYCNPAYNSVNSGLSCSALYLN